MTHLLLLIIYLSFISLGLPDSLLGASWPAMYSAFGVPISFMGMVSMIIAAGTIVSSLMSDRLTRRFGTGMITAVSVATTAVALAGFSFTHSFWPLCLWAVPYGLGAGSVDASINNYVALHYPSRHMSWLHCMWGIGASLGPLSISLALRSGYGWNAGYRGMAALQAALAAILLLSLPLWKQHASARFCGAAPSQKPSSQPQPIRLQQVVALSGAKEAMLVFFCYCALEQTASLWTGSYLMLHLQLPAKTAAGMVSLFFLGVTSGRFFSGFLTLKLSDVQMVRLGQCLLLAGIAALLFFTGVPAARAGLLLLGLGCAPIYPCCIHATPARFGADVSQAIIGVQMASAYVGTCAMPPLFALIANHIGAGCLPLYLLLLGILMAVMHQRLLQRCTVSANSTSV